MKFGNFEYFQRRVIEYTRQGFNNPKKKILSETVELVPRKESNKLSETVYKEVFANGQPSSRLRIRSVYPDKEFGTRTLYQNSLPSNYKPQLTRIEVTDRTYTRDEVLGYGYGDENMKTHSSYRFSKDGSYLEREEHDDIGVINVPNRRYSSVTEYKPDCHIEYIDGKTRIYPPVFYSPIQVLKNHV